MTQNNKTNKSFLKHNGKKFKKNPVHVDESSSSDQEQDPEVFFQPSQAQAVLNMFMSYIEGPKMDWTVNDGLYHSFLKVALEV